MAAIYGKVLGETSSAKLSLQALSQGLSVGHLARPWVEAPQFVLYLLADRTVTYRQAHYIV